jgi:hypothetical protein
MSNPNDSYEEGRYRRPYSGGNWNEFVRGQNDRARWTQWSRTMQANGRSTAPAPMPSHSGSRDNSGGERVGGGSGILGLLTFGALLLALVFAVPAAAVAIVGAPIIMLAARLLPPNYANPGYGTAWRAAFFGALLYLAVTTGIAWGCQYAVQSMPHYNDTRSLLAFTYLEAIRTLYVVGKFALGEPLTWPPILAQTLLPPVHLTELCLLHTPGLLAFALGMRSVTDAPFARWRGLLFAVPVSLLTLAVSVPAAAWIGVHIFRHAHISPLATTINWEGVLPLAVGSLLAYGLIAGLITTCVLWLLVRREFGSLYVVAFRALTAYALVGALLLLLFRDADALIGLLWLAASPSRPLSYLLEHKELVLQTLRGFLLLQAPAVLLVGALIGPKLRPPMSGFASYAMASLVGGMVATTTAAAFLILILPTTTKFPCVSNVVRCLWR